MHFKPTIGMELHKLSNMAMRYMDNNSHKKLVDSVTGTNGWILGYMAHHRDSDVFQRDLEEAFGVTRSTVSKVINLMEQKGLIARSPVEYDARLKKLTLTPKSLELVTYMHDDNEKMESALTFGFSENEKEMLLDFINRMQENLRQEATKSGFDIDKAVICDKGGNEND